MDHSFVWISIEKGKVKPQVTRESEGIYLSSPPQSLFMRQLPQRRVMMSDYLVSINPGNQFNIGFFSGVVSKLTSLTKSGRCFVVAKTGGCEDARRSAVKEKMENVSKNREHGDEARNDQGLCESVCRLQLRLDLALSPRLWKQNNWSLVTSAETPSPCNDLISTLALSAHPSPEHIQLIKVITAPVNDAFMKPELLLRVLPQLYCALYRGAVVFT
ncbi:uncharacterized protein V6R79_004420 [Siganus canaliculatus]